MSNSFPPLSVAPIPAPRAGGAPAESLIRAEALSVLYPGTPALRNVSLSLCPGEIVTVVGPNGSGKSTLVRSLLGAITPDEGRVTRREGLRIGYVPQKLALDPTLPMTVNRFIDLPGRGLFDRSARARTRAALERTGAAGLGDRPLSGLSGGQLQRVLLARALLGEPHLLILDEPTQGLDQPGAAAFYQLIERLRNETGVAILMVSHDLHVVMAASDRVICLNGHVCCEGTPSHVAAAPEYRALFGFGTGGALALYRHEHDHDHEGHVQGHLPAVHQHGPDCNHSHAPFQLPRGLTAPGAVSAGQARGAAAGWQPPVAQPAPDKAEGKTGPKDGCGHDH